MNTKTQFPKFFFYLLIAMALAIFVGIFFSVKFVGATYFVVIIICFVYYLLDKKYGKKLSNYKQTFFMFDLINLVAMVGVLYYEFTYHTTLINALLIALITIEFVQTILDLTFIKNTNFTTKETVFIDGIKLGAMICFLTYFYKVSTFWYAVIALTFEVINLILKIYYNIHNGKIMPQENEKINEKAEKTVEEIIQQQDNDDEIEGDLD